MDVLLSDQFLISLIYQLGIVAMSCLGDGWIGKAAVAIVFVFAMMMQLVTYISLKGGF